MNSKLSIVTKGIFKENPTLILNLGMCPSLGVTTSAINGIGMGNCHQHLSSVMSNIMISFS